MASDPAVCCWSSASVPGPRHWWAAGSAVACCLIVAGWLSLSEKLYLFSSDSLIPTLASTMQWTFYFWESDRLGQLLPLLAMPVQDPLGNNMLQCFLGVLLGIGVLFLLPAFLPAFASSRNDSWLAAGTITVAAILLCSPPKIFHIYLPGSHTYGPSLCLTLGGLLLATPRWSRRHFVGRLATAVALVTCGLWVNLAVFIFAAILIAVDALLWARRKHPAVEDTAIGRLLDRRLPWLPAWIRDGVTLVIPMALVLATGLIVNIVARKIFAPEIKSAYSHTSFGITPLEVYPGAVLQMIRNAVTDYLGIAGLGFVAASVVAAAWLWRRGSLPAAVTTLWITAGLFLLAVCGLRHVSLGNACNARYVLPSIVTIQAAAGLVAAGVIREMAGAYEPFLRRSLVCWGSPVVIVLALAVAVGPPSPDVPRRLLTRFASPEAEEILESGVGFIAGDYWAVWPTVFKVNLLLAERGETRRVWGIGYRASVTKHRWIDTAPDGSGRLAYLKAAPQHYGYALDWLAENLDLEIGPCERSTERIDYRRFRFAPPDRAAMKGHDFAR